jgi:hypothetical protein
MKTEINVQIKSVYGNELVYPACETASAFASLLKTKTFDDRSLEIIKSLGFEINYVPAYQPKN